MAIRCPQFVAGVFQQAGEYVPQCLRVDAPDSLREVVELQRDDEPAPKVQPIDDARVTQLTLADA